MESSKSGLFEFIKKNLTFQLFIMQIFEKFAKNGKSVMFSIDMLLLKNPKFLTNHYETLSKWGTRHEYLILTKFRNDWLKIVGFLIKSVVSL